MLILIVLRWTRVAHIVKEYILTGLRLLTRAIEFQMIRRGVGESQELRQKCPNRKEGWL